MEQERIQHLLRTYFTAAKGRNSAYTIRSFAKKLKISPGSLSEILNGHRRVSLKLATRLAEALLLDPQQKAELFQPMNGTVKKKRRDNQYLKLSADQFHAISEWQHFAIVSLMKTTEFQSDPKWIASRLGISEKVAFAALERMQRLGLIVFDTHQGYQRTQMALRTSDEIISSSVQKSHFEDLDLAKKSLESTPLTARDFTSITMAINTSKMKEAKQLIRDFQDKMSELLEGTDASEVYKMSVYLYPLSKIKDV